MRKQFRKNGALMLFLFIGYCLGRGISQPSNRAQVVASQDKVNLESGTCTYCGFDPHFCVANYSQSLPTAAESGQSGH